MRDFASCLGEYAVDVSDASCSSYSNNSLISQNLVPSIQISVTCVYQAILSNQNQILVTITWTKTNLSQGLNISFGDHDNPLTTFKLNSNSRLFRKKKGSKSLDLPHNNNNNDNNNNNNNDNYTKCEILWDLSGAQYKTGPEPFTGYYVVITFDTQVGLILGDMGQEIVAKKLKASTKIPKLSLVTRREHFSGNTHYATKAQFCETGVAHDIVIKCSGENEGLKYPVLSVCIGKKMVTRVKRLHLNFRGNQSIFVDGLLVDLFWDVHDWFFNPASGYAVFMFRTRSGTDSRLWLEEKLMHKDQNNQMEKVEFSFLIYACNSRN